MSAAPSSMVLSALASSPVYISLGSLLIVISAVALILPLRASNRNRDSAATPPRSVSPDLSEKTLLTGTLSTAATAESLAGILTNIFPGNRKGSLPSPLTHAPRTARTETPITNRTKEEITAYGRFPDYAALSGVPLPKPYTEFDIKKALPRPYRPFRWAYHQTMSFTKMEPDWWLELENTYIERTAQRKAIYARHGTDILQSLPGSEAACNELMEMVIQFLVTRYPQYFSLETRVGTDSEILVNRILNKETHIRDVPPLEVILENIPEDFAVVIKNQETGDYEFRAGVACSALGWNLGSKIGMNLREIHQPIPDYKEKMSMSMDRYFSKMPTSTPIQRGSWGLEYNMPFYLPPDDPHAEIRTRQDPELAIKDVFLRVDWQTLRRLPLSGAIVFNFKALFTPIEEFADEPGVPAVVLEVLEKGKKSLMEYKGTWHVEHVAKPALENWRKEQVAKGVVDKEWEVSTLDEYPMFEGWKEKWHRQQGF